MAKILWDFEIKIQVDAGQSTRYCGSREELEDNSGDSCSGAKYQQHKIQNTIFK